MIRLFCAIWRHDLVWNNSEMAFRCDRCKRRA